MLFLFGNLQFRLLWAASAGSMIATSTLAMLSPWLALEVTDSPFWVGFTAGVGGIGLLLFSPPSGILIDRFDRRILAAGVSLIQAVLALIIATVIFIDAIELWLIITVSFVNSLTHSTREPAITALTLDVTGKDRLLSGLAAIHMSMGTMATIAPLIAGFVVARFGLDWAFMIVVAANLVGMTLFLAVRLPETLSPKSSLMAVQSFTPWKDIKEVLSFAWSSPIVRILLAVSIAAELLTWGHTTLISVVARDVLGTDASGLGYLLAAASIGGVVGALALALGGWVRADDRLVMIGIIGFAIFLVAFSASRNLALSMTLMAFGYAMAAVYETTMSTLLQTVVPNQMRGRILSLLTMTWGLTGVSGFYMGTIARAAGAPIAIGLSAGLMILIMLPLFIRSVYMKSAEEDK